MRFEGYGGLSMPCLKGDDLTAWLQGELEATEARTIRAHVEACYRCREEAGRIQEVLDGLRPRRGVGGHVVDLAPALLARVEAERRARAAGRFRRLAAAAVLIAAGGAIVALLVPAGSGGAPDALARSAIEWLERAQEPSGGFSAARWGGRSEHDVGLTGLAALALLPHREARGASARAIDSILSRQSAEGRFGPEVRDSAYNHGIATVAVLEGFEAGGGERLRDPLDRALAHIRKTQHEHGGWGYAGAELEGPNTAATCWPLQALLRARALGWSGLDASIDDGFRYLARVADRSGRLGYRRAGELEGDALSSLGALCVLLARDDLSVPAALRGRLLDQVARATVRSRPGEELYRDFFIASVAGALPADRRKRWRSDAREALGLLQVREGPDRGSWEPRDVWSPAGGRVYATALGALILDASGQGGRS